MQDADLTPFGIYTVNQAAAFLGCDRTTLYRWIEDDILVKPARFGSMRVFTKKQLLAAQRVRRGKHGLPGEGGRHRRKARPQPG